MTSITLRTLSLVLTVALLTLASSTEAATIYVNAKAKGARGTGWHVLADRFCEFDENDRL